MRSFVPRYEVVFSDGRLFNTRYTKETHNKNSTYRKFCTGKISCGWETMLNLPNKVLPIRKTRTDGQRFAFFKYQVLRRLRFSVLHPSAPEYDRRYIPRRAP